MNTTEAKVGDKVKLTGETVWNNFNIGDVVECVGVGLFSDGTVTQWVTPGDYELTHTTPEKGTLAELNVKPGDVVECVEYDGGYWTPGKHYKISPSCEILNNDGSLYDIHSPHEFVGRIISRATPQRYVVMTYTDTVIATRAEAEDLATSGGVLAVYKLGDEVGITTTVTLD